MFWVSGCKNLQRTLNPEHFKQKDDSLSLPRAWKTGLRFELPHSLQRVLIHCCAGLGTWEWWMLKPTSGLGEISKLFKCLKIWQFLFAGKNFLFLTVGELCDRASVRYVPLKTGNPFLNSWTFSGCAMPPIPVTAFLQQSVKMYVLA